MKKNIGLVNLDSSLIRWLHEKLRISAPETQGRADLIEGLEDLMNGIASSLMLQLGDEEIPALANDVIQCGALSIYARSRKIILYFLARNCGEVFTKEQIYRAVWENDYLLDDSNIMAFIRKLRKKIEPNPDAPEYILTIWGIGYKFNDKL